MSGLVFWKSQHRKFCKVQKRDPNWPQLMCDETYPIHMLHKTQVPKCHKMFTIWQIAKKCNCRFFLITRISVIKFRWSQTKTPGGAAFQNCQRNVDMSSEKKKKIISSTCAWCTNSFQRKKKTLKKCHNILCLSGIECIKNDFRHNFFQQLHHNNGNQSFILIINTMDTCEYEALRHHAKRKKTTDLSKIPLISPQSLQRTGCICGWSRHYHLPVFVWPQESNTKTEKRYFSKLKTKGLL